MALLENFFEPLSVTTIFAALCLDALNRSEILWLGPIESGLGQQYSLKRHSTPRVHTAAAKAKRQPKRTQICHGVVMANLTRLALLLWSVLANSLLAGAHEVVNILDCRNSTQSQLAEAVRNLREVSSYTVRQPQGRTGTKT